MASFSYQSFSRSCVLFLTGWFICFSDTCWQGLVFEQRWEEEDEERGVRNDRVLQTGAAAWAWRASGRRNDINKRTWVTVTLKGCMTGDSVCVAPSDTKPLSISLGRVARWGSYEAHPKIPSPTHTHTLPHRMHSLKGGGLMIANKEK